MSLGRDSCWCSSCFKSRKKWIHLSTQEKKQKTKKKLCWYVQLHQFTAFLHLPWKFARQCTLNVKHCKLVTAFLRFFKFQRLDFFPFSTYFPQRAETKLFLMWRSWDPEKIFAFACMALHVPRAQLPEVLRFERITWRADAYKWKMKLLLLSPGFAKANKCRANCVCKGRELRKLEVSWMITSL